jgi:regulator of nonsense transcripts 2
MCSTLNDFRSDFFLSFLLRLLLQFCSLFPLLISLYISEFFGMMKTKNHQYIDNKIRNVRYLGELVKFGIAPPITAFRMFKTMMSDFSSHNIELTACLLETCGRYLYLLPYTHERTCEIIETMLRSLFFMGGMF